MSSSAALMPFSSVSRIIKREPPPEGPWLPPESNALVISCWVTIVGASSGSGFCSRFWASTIRGGRSSAKAAATATQAGDDQQRPPHDDIADAVEDPPWFRRLTGAGPA